MRRRRGEWRACRTCIISTAARPSRASLPPPPRNARGSRPRALRGLLWGERALLRARRSTSPPLVSRELPSRSHTLQTSPRRARRPEPGPPCRFAAITGWGACSRPAVLTNADLSTFLDTIGRVDHEPDRHEGAARLARLRDEMATVASRRALACAGLDAADLDLIVYGSCQQRRAGAE